jgi:hypothetical protein
MRAFSTETPHEDFEVREKMRKSTNTIVRDNILFQSNSFTLFLEFKVYEAEVNSFFEA